MRAHDFIESEGDPEGLPHMTPTLIKHIIQQIDTEGPHAISKSVEWGDGASRELTAYIVDKLKDLVDTEEVDEMAGEIHGGIRKVLKDKGYQYLGSGIDKQAWLEPGTGQVIIIFGYHKQHNKEFSPDQRMFIDWINYCNQHSNNPHLPRFSGFESFQFRGQHYIQSRMERLQEVPTILGQILHFLQDHVGEAEGNYEDAINDMIDKKGINTNLGQVIEKLGGTKSTAELFNTVRQVMQFGINHRFNIDLHRGNYMQRPDGTIVVNDPFVLWLGGSKG